MTLAKLALVDNMITYRIQRRLTAGAACENLKARCPYFYAAAKGFSDLCAPLAF